MSDALRTSHARLTLADDLRSRISQRTALIAVIGCGYVGLPLLLSFAQAGFRAIGVERDAGRVRALREGRSYIGDVSEHELADQVRAGRLTATGETAALADADVIFVSVPTPFDRAKQPDLSFVISAAEAIGQHVRRGQLIVLESTTFPGTTDEVLRPILERTGLRAGEDFYLAFSPERIDPGNRTYRIANTPKVVGGIDPVSTELAALALSQIITASQVHTVTSARAAELTKLLENTFRAVNIALVNELAMLCDRMDLDIWEIIDAAATKPYGFMPFYPGPGVGGHCIPVDPYYLSWKAREFDFHTKFIELAAETNLAMPFYTAGRIRRFLNRHGKPLVAARVLVLGATFKKDIEDARNSAAIRVMEILANEGGVIQYHDPYVPEIRLNRSLYGESDTIALRSTALDDGIVQRADCVVILVAHSSVDYDRLLAQASLVFDAVNATDGRAGSAVVDRL